MMMNKSPFLYSLGKTIFAPIFKCYYHPTIKGKENLQISGSKIIASNHIHLYDQCHSIISTKEFITFMAKREYFDSKKTHWFFSSVGCIPVDRTKKDDEAVKSAIDILNRGGNVGIFPEGTRNSFKKEKIKELYEYFKRDIDYNVFSQKISKNKPSEINYLIKLVEDEKISKKEFLNNLANSDKYLRELIEKKIITEEEYFDTLLLEFKFGSVSMAQKTDSCIIPVAITGKYKFRSKNLVVNYGVPFKVTNMDLIEANRLLRKKIIELLKENMEGRTYEK